jgi:hypothetical protein
LNGTKRDPKPHKQLQHRLLDVAVNMATRWAAVPGDEDGFAARYKLAVNVADKVVWQHIDANRHRRINIDDVRAEIATALDQLASEAGTVSDGR